MIGRSARNENLVARYFVQLNTRMAMIGGADFMGAPSTAALTTTAYNTWATANNQPLQSTAAGAAIYNGIVNIVNAPKERLRRTAGELLHHSAAVEFL